MDAMDYTTHLRYRLRALPAQSPEQEAFVEILDPEDKRVGYICARLVHEDGEVWKEFSLRTIIGERHFRIDLFQDEVRYFLDEAFVQHVQKCRALSILQEHQRKEKDSFEMGR